MSVSTFLKLNNSDEYRFHLNYENYENILELYDLKTGEITADFAYDIFQLDMEWRDNLRPHRHYRLFELNENNQYLLLFHYQSLGITHIIVIFSFNEIPGKKINFLSLNVIKKYELKENFFYDTYNSNFHLIQTKSGNIFFSLVGQYSIEYDLYIYNLNENKFYIMGRAHSQAFQKLLYLKDEMMLLCHGSYGDDYRFYIKIVNYVDKQIELISSFQYSPNQIQFRKLYESDLLLFSETKAIYVSIFKDEKILKIYIINFFEDYNICVVNELKVKILGMRLNVENNKYPICFKYKDLLGFNLMDSHRKNGFILFGYFNSTDPKQIYDIKKDGLNYMLDLEKYLNLQSNILGYKIRGIKIIQIPPLNESGIFLISNNTNDIIRKDDIIDLYTQISIGFEYNRKIKKGNYLFKFAGVLQEATFEELKNISENIMWKNNSYLDKDDIVNQFNERRNMNIIGKVALIQINVLDDIKVFCDKNYDETTLKDKEGNNIICQKGKFYDVENVNEITQSKPGINYYFNENKVVFIKCHKRCKTCSIAFNLTHMNCDECFENYFLKNNDCLEISKCEYNYYYDENLDLKCITRNISCPDFKPYEKIDTKECIAECNIDEFNIICNPTNNLVGINETYKKIFKNIKYLNISEKLFKNKEKYVIKGNNVSFIFTTTEIEKEELYTNNESSTIILNNIENNLAILKIETFNNHSNKMELYFELFNQSNLSQKLDINLYSPFNYEVRFPLDLKKYKMDLLKKVKDLGYDIFDLNSSFYNDICSVFTYNNSDITLSERKTLLDLSDEDLYRNNCSYINSDIKTLRSIYLCKIGNDLINNNSSDIIENDINIENNNFLDLVSTNIKNINMSKTWNIKVVKCFSIIFTKKLFTDNYGFYITFFLNIFNILFLVYYPIPKVVQKFNEFCTTILSQMKKINNYKISNLNDIKDKSNNEILNTKDINNNNENILKEGKNKKKKKRTIINNRPNILGGIIKSEHSSKNAQVNNYLNKNIIDNNSGDKKEKDDKEKSKEKEGLDGYIDNLVKYVDLEKRVNYLSESELENLSYEYALKIDKRIRQNIYFSLLKEKNKIISIFLNDEDYNISSVKLSLFLFNFNLSLTINALFYNDAAISEINQSQNSSDISSQIARIALSTLISIAIGFIVEKLALTYKDIIKLKYFKDIKLAENNVPILIKKLKVKYVLYYLITIFFNFLFFYYITAFCAIYSIIQINMITDSIISFIIALSYSIIFSILTSVIRVFSLQKNNKFRHFFYIISWIISLI